MRSIRDEIERAFLAQLKRAKTTDDIRYVEAKAARVWWRQWNEFGMRFAGPSVPAEWGVFLAAQFQPPRLSPVMQKPKHGSNPIAMIALVILAVTIPIA
jgi:hypothetical protein